MKRVDPAGALQHVLARLNPFSNYTWARDRATGLRFRVNVRDVVGRHILRFQGYEHALTAWLVQRLDAAGSDGVFVDVGANLGWYSLQAARRDSVARVVAIEPELGNHQLLRTNIERNRLGPKVHAIACAAGAGPGLAMLHSYKPSNLGKHSLAVDHGRGGGWVGVEALDTLLDRLGLGDAPIAAIKIDVEGYEPQVLQGAKRALARTGALLIELSPDLSRQGGLDLPSMIDAIRAAGLHPAIWDREGPVPDFEAIGSSTRQITVGFERRGG